MTLKKFYKPGLLALGALAVGALIADPSWAQAPAAAPAAAAAEPVVNKGDNAWMLVSTVLVLLMTIPGLALFYGGLVRSKNFLSVLSHVFYCVFVLTGFKKKVAFGVGTELVRGVCAANNNVSRSLVCRLHSCRRVGKGRADQAAASFAPPVQSGRAIPPCKPARAPPLAVPARHSERL